MALFGAIQPLQTTTVGAQTADSLEQTCAANPTAAQCGGGINIDGRTDVTKGAGWSNANSVQSTLYARALMACMERSLTNSDIGNGVVLTSQQASATNEWDPILDDGALARGTGLDPSGDGVLACENENGWIDSALALWNINSKTEAICIFGWYRSSTPTPQRSAGTYNDCVNGSGGYFINSIADPNTPSAFISTTSPSNFAQRLSFARGVQVQPSRTITYLIYQQAFTNDSAGCRAEQLIKRADANPDQVAILDSNKGVLVKVVEGTGVDAELVDYIFEFAGDRNESSTVAVSSYLANRDLFVNASTGSRSPAADGKQECAYIKDVMNSLSGSYLESVLSGTANPDEDASSCTLNPNDSGCREATSCNVEGIGWMVCPVLNALGGLTDAMFVIIEDILLLNPLQTTQPNSDEPTNEYVAWQRIRDIANVLLVIAFLIIIFSQLTSVGVSNYGVKKLLPRLIMVAILINASFIVMMLAIDVVNILGSSLYNILVGLAPDITVLDDDNAISSFVTGLLTASTAGAIGFIAGGVIGPGALALMAVPFILTSVLALFAAVATLFIRNALVVILVLVAPLAFTAMLLPNTQSLFDRWRKLLIGALFMYPVAAILFGGTKFAAYTLAGSGEPLSILVAIFVMAAPLGMLPFLARSSGGILSTIGGQLQGLAKSAKSPLKNLVNPIAANRTKNYQAGRTGMFGRRRSDEEIERRASQGKRNWGQRVAESKAMRDTDSAAADKTLANNAEARSLTGAKGDEKFKRAYGSAQTQQLRSSAIGEKQKGALLERTATAGSVESGYSLEQFASSEDNKATEGRILQTNRDSGVANASIRQQKRNEKLAKRFEAAREKEFIQGVATPTNAADTAVSDAILETSRDELSSSVAQGVLDVRKDTEMEQGGSMFEENLQLRALKNASAASNSSVDQIEAEAKTGSTDARLAGIDPATRTMLQDADRQQKQAQSAISGAQDYGRQEDAVELQANPVLAQQFAGISPTGPAGVVAQATQVVDKARQEAVAAETVIIRDKRYKPADVLANLGTGLSPDGTTASTPEQQMAMVQYVMQNGTAEQVMELADQMSSTVFDPNDPVKGPSNARVLQTFASAARSTGRVKSIGAGALAQLDQGEQIGSFADQIHGRVDNGKYDPTAIAGMDVAEVGAIHDFFINDPRGQSTDRAKKDALMLAINTRLNDPRLKESLNEESRKALVDLYSTLTT